MTTPDYAAMRAQFRHCTESFLVEQRQPTDEPDDAFGMALERELIYILAAFGAAPSNPHQEPHP